MYYIIILGGPLTHDLLPDKWLLSRLEISIKYYEKIKQEIKDDIRIIVTGGYTYDKQISEANVMKKYLVERKIPEKIIIEENKAMNTIENAIYSKKIIMKDNSKHNIIVVTSDFHVPRSNIIFSHEFGKHYNIPFIGADTQINDVHERRKIYNNERILINKLKKYYKIC